MTGAFWRASEGDGGRWAPRPGPRNDLTDVAGLTVGHAVDPAARTGVTVVRCAGLTVAAVDVRGGGPATRETDALAPDALVGGAHALVFSGGSVFGLGAADGVVDALCRDGVGLRLTPDAPAIPIAPAAAIYDLGVRPAQARPDADAAPDYPALGRAAAAAANKAGPVALGPVALGSVGAGVGATAGTAAGGVGAASLDLGGGLVVAALVVANPVGSPFMPDGKTFWAWPLEIDGEFGGARPDPSAPPVIAPLPDDGKLKDTAPVPRFNTTIGVVATSAALTQAEARRVAMMAHDGLARAVRPAHTPLDGDAFFALATGAAEIVGPRPIDLARLGSASADCVARAVARGVHAAM